MVLVICHFQVKTCLKVKNKLNCNTFQMLKKRGNYIYFTVITFAKARLTACPRGILALQPVSARIASSTCSDPT